MVRASSDVALFLSRADGFHFGGMRHLQLLAVGLQRVVDPAAEQGRFQRSSPGLRLRRGPLLQRPALRRNHTFFHDLAGCGLDTKTDGFLVNVESDIVRAVHGVLLVSFLSRRFLRRSQHRSRSENPSSFHLCIHTDGTGTNLLNGPSFSPVSVFRSLAAKPRIMVFNFPQPPCDI